MTETMPIAILKGMKQNVRSSGKRDALHLAIQALREKEESIDKLGEILDNIGNKYVFHTEPTDDYTTGYNAAVREIISILKKGVTPNETDV